MQPQNQNTVHTRRDVLKRISVALLAPLIGTGCGGGSSTGAPRTIEVTTMRPPYPSEDGLRIGYLLKTWMYETEGLCLTKIEIGDAANLTTISTFLNGIDDWPTIYKDPVQSLPYLPQSGQMNAYYIPIQLKIANGAIRPERIFHRLTLSRLGSTESLIVDGGFFSPRYAESPLVIPSPLKGNNLWFNNQGENSYHFNFLAFAYGAPYAGMMFAFDSGQLNASMTSLLRDDGSKNPLDNDAYCNYGQPIYSVTDGTVMRVIDGYEAQQGNHQVYPITEENLGGNNLIIDIGGGRYAFYAHCIKGSFGNLKVGDRIRQGQAIARLGNSGNSTAPHLHFHIFEGGQDPIWSQGVPFVIQQFDATATITSSDDPTMCVTVTRKPSPKAQQNVMPEKLTVFNAL